VFDGLKAFRGVDGDARVFRPQSNAKRLQNSCERLCMPTVDEETFCAAIEALIELDHAWMPSKKGDSLYVRPLMIGTESHLDVRPDVTYRFMVMTAPVGSYFGQRQGGVSLKAEEQFTRAAALGGLGGAKTAANYAAGMFATQKARAEGFDHSLWLDSNEHRFVEEVGAMNIFFKKNGTVITPPLSGSILPGVTRDSVITMLGDRGIPMEERPISIDEVLESVKDGSMEEVFGAGTAAVISPVERLAFKGESVTLATVPGPLTLELYEEILGIQNGGIEDRHGWNMIVPIPKAEPVAATAR